MLEHVGRPIWVQTTLYRWHGALGSIKKNYKGEMDSTITADNISPGDEASANDRHNHLKNVIIGPTSKKSRKD